MEPRGVWQLQQSVGKKTNYNLHYEYVYFLNVINGVLQLNETLI